MHAHSCKKKWTPYTRAWKKRKKDELSNIEERRKEKRPTISDERNVGEKWEKKRTINKATKPNQWHQDSRYTDLTKVPTPCQFPKRNIIVAYTNKHTLGITS